MSTAKILIVDDSAASAKLLRAVLVDAGHEVAVISRSSDALPYLEAHAVDLIAMDLQLPGVDGLTLTRRIRALPRFDHIVIVAVTAYAMRGDEERALAAGCDGYLTKPLDVASLPHRFAALLRSRRSTAG